MGAVVKRSEIDPEPVEIIAQAIIDISDAMKTVASSRLSRRAIVTLVHEQSKIARRDIELVLNNLEQLERTWLKAKTPSK